MYGPSITPNGYPVLISLSSYPNYILSLFTSTLFSVTLWVRFVVFYDDGGQFLHRILEKINRYSI